MSRQSSSYRRQDITSTEPHSNSPKAERSTTPQPRPHIPSYFASAGRSSPPYVSPYARIEEPPAEEPTVPPLHSQPTSSKPSTSLNPELRGLSLTHYPAQSSMSTYSSSSANSSIYDSPNPQKYRGTIGIMSNAKQISAVSTRHILKQFPHGPG